MTLFELGVAPGEVLLCALVGQPRKRKGIIVDTMENLSQS
jgi:hypothetical protein